MQNVRRVLFVLEISRPGSRSSRDLPEATVSEIDFQVGMLISLLFVGGGGFLCNNAKEKRCQNGPKISPISNMTFGQKSPFLRQRLKPRFWGGGAQCPTSNMEKLKKFDREVVFAQNLKNPFFYFLLFHGLRYQMCCSRSSFFFVVAALGALFAILAYRPDLILPHKINAAVSLKGWDGFSKIIVANVAQRTKGQRTTKSREAWYRLLESMRDIDVHYLSPRSDVVTVEEVAQGHEFALHLLSIGLEAYVINADTTRPKFKNLFNPDHKWLVDQPDAIYLTATIATGHSYVIRGKQEGQVYFSYTIYTHKRGGGWAENILSETAFPKSSVSGLNLQPNKNGEYAVYVSSTRPKKSLEPNEQWLRIPEKSGPAEVSVLARHYFEGPVSIQMYEGRQKSDVVATIDVVVSDVQGRRSSFPPIPTDENVAQRIDFLSNFLIDHTIKMGPGVRNF